MPAWQDYTSQIDQVLGSLDPKVRAVVTAYTGRNAAENRDLSNRNYNIAMAELKASGYSQEDANTLLQIAYNVRRGGGWDTNTPMSGGETFRVEPQTLEAFFARGAQQGGAKRDINSQIQAFIDSMTGPMAPNDPIRLSLVQAGQDAAQGAAGRAGLGASGRSGLAQSSAASLAQRNIVPYEAQRKQMAQQGLSLLNQRDLGLGQLQQGYTQLQNQQADAQWAAQQNQNQALVGAIGSGVGAIAGGYFGGAQGASAGMQAGAQFGGGLGSLMGGGRGPSYSMPSLGGGGRNPYTGY